LESTQVTLLLHRLKNVSLIDYYLNAENKNCQPLFQKFFYFFQPIFPSNIWRTNLVFLVKKWLSLPEKKYAKGHAWPLRSKKGSG